MRYFLISCVCVFIVSCHTPLPHIDGVDGNLWKGDRNACMGRRKPMIKAIASQKEKLKRLAEMQVIALLGRPDQNELFGRNQKSYVYYLEPGPRCKNAQKSHRKLIIRFNAVGVAKEVFIR